MDSHREGVQQDFNRLQCWIYFKWAYHQLCLSKKPGFDAAYVTWSIGTEQKNSFFFCSVLGTKRKNPSEGFLKKHLETWTLFPNFLLWPTPIWKEMWQVPCIVLLFSIYLLPGKASNSSPETPNIHRQRSQVGWLGPHLCQTWDKQPRKTNAWLARKNQPRNHEWVDVSPIKQSWWFSSNRHVSLPGVVLLMEETSCTTWNV